MPNVELSREDAYLVQRLLTEMERDERLDEQYRRGLDTNMTTSDLIQFGNCPAA